MQSPNPGLDMSNAATVPLELKAERKRILIVDDESDISSAMKIGLEDNGYTVDTFNDPLAALTNYKAGYYDLLLFDVRMPQMTGFELYRRIREADGKSNVCFLTAFEVYTEEFRKVFPSMDVKHFIQKPISMEDLVRKIKELT
jgi:DNA-binding response OmpR family regulator